MKLEWMGEQRDLIEKFIRLFNTYARQYSHVYSLEGTSVITSAAQIQTLEYIIEVNGEEKMSEIAAKLGITRGAFSNNVKKLIQNGYLEKSQGVNNHKDIFLTATTKGLQAYQEYSRFIYDGCFKEIFRLADTIPPEHLDTFKEILNCFTHAFNAKGLKNDF